MTKVTSVRLDDEMANKLDRLAASLDRPRTWLIEQAIASYVEEQSWQVAAISEALDDYRSGNAAVTPHEQVMDRLAAKLRNER
jgi:predicted transcriptional regulator